MLKKCDLLAQTSVPGQSDAVDIEMRLQSDIDALAAIEEDAKAMLKRIGLPDDAQKLEVVIVLRQIVDLATYMESADRFIEAPIIA